MEVCIKYKKSNLNETKLMVIKEFIFFLQKEFPLKDDVTVLFTDKSDKGMTTGSNKLGRIRVLSKGRMLIDVMQTSHMNGSMNINTNIIGREQNKILVVLMKMRRISKRVRF